MAASWLKNAVFYEIYPQTFYDTNGDGIGDLQGIIEKLPYVKSLGCNAIWMNPCFDSPFKDGGYDVRDYYQVAPRYGTNEDLVRLFDGPFFTVFPFQDLLRSRGRWNVIVSLCRRFRIIIDNRI